MSCVLSLSNVQGQTDPERVKAGLSALSQAVTNRIVRQGEAREVEMRVTLAPDGTVQSAAYVGQAFASEALNQFILAQAKRLDFGRPLDSAPAGFTIKISVQ